MSIIGVLIFWDAADDPTITNYKIYCGSAVDVYDAPLSPLTVENVLSSYFPVPGPGLWVFKVNAVSTAFGEYPWVLPFTVQVPEPTGTITFMKQGALVS